MEQDNRYRTQPLARWFKWAALASLAWYLLGCALYLLEVTTDPATLPADQRAMVEAAPTWMWAAYAIAVWVGLVGAVLLLMRRRLAVPLLLVSLLAVLVQFSAYFLHAPLSEAVSSDMLLVPIVVVALTWTVFWFAYHSHKRGWLR